MFTYEQFKRLNRSSWTESEMQKNYDIALKVEQTYYKYFGPSQEPKMGDIVEFTNGYNVYTRAKITENLYQKKDGVTICENGSSFTQGTYFNTSGGAFHCKSKSDLQYVGEDENIVWTWGCKGAGAHQGIYLPIKVRKWIDAGTTKFTIHGAFKVTHMITLFNLKILK